ncbi:MAG: MarC family protein [Xanthobacteraceae bacterium]|nr:MarC family protein [Xanthobacteraceae bacterium]
MPFEFLISALVTLLVVVDPVGLVPTFLGLTDGVSAKFRRGIAWRACLIAGAILIGAALIGDWLLRNLGITLPAFRIAGGLLLFAVASEMVLGLRLKHTAEEAEQAAEEHLHNMAAFPLAIPLMAGPGAITATILLAGQANARPELLAVLLVVIVAVIGACFVCFAAGDRIGKLLGVTGNVVLSRLLGVILAALAVQFVVDGIRAAFGL